MKFGSLTMNILLPRIFENYNISSIIFLVFLPPKFLPLKNVIEDTYSVQACGCDHIPFR